MAQPTPGSQFEQQRKFLPGEQFAAVRAEAEKLAAQGQRDEAIAHCEAFIREHSDAVSDNPGGFGGLKWVVYRLVTSMDDKAAKSTHFRRIYEEFKEVPLYGAMGASCYLNYILWTHGDLETAEAFGLRALESFGQQLPHTHDGAMLLVNLGRVLQRRGKIDEALELALAAPSVFPTILEYVSYHRLLFDCALSRNDADGMLSAAKSAFMLCAFTEEAVDKARGMVIQALTLRGGPELAGQFVKSQESPELENPLAEAPSARFCRARQGTETGADRAGEARQPVDDPAGATDYRRMVLDEAALLAAAGEWHDRVSVQLALGDLDGAMADALKAVREAVTEDYMLRALRDVARCFKAKDLDLVRANQFIEYAKSGEGANPVRAY